MCDRRTCDHPDRRAARPRRPRARAARRRGAAVWPPLRRSCRRSGSTTTAAASCSTRSPGCPSTTRPRPSGRSCAPRPTAIAAASGADTLVELGSGTSDKTRTLLDAFAASRAAANGSCPSRSTRRRCATPPTTIAEAYPGIDVHAVVGDFERHLGGHPTGGPAHDRLPRQHDRQLRAGRAQGVPRRPDRPPCAPATRLLLGTDLVKDVGRLEARLRRQPGRHRRVQPQRAARGEPRARRRLRRRRPSTTSRSSTATRSGSRCGCERAPPSASRSRPSTFRSTSTRARRCAPRSAPSSVGQGVEAELAAAGLRLDRWMTDPADDFALSLSFVD